MLRMVWRLSFGGISFQLLLLADARQSAMIRREPDRYYGKNHLVKKYGNKYFVAAGAGHAAISFCASREGKERFGSTGRLPCRQGSCS